jgi:hypothetical protein
MKRRKTLYIISIFVIILAILAGIFNMQIRGYKKIGEIDNWYLYEKQNEVCATALEPIYNDGTNTYYLPCISSQFYVVKNGFKEYYINEALEEGIITIDEAMLYFPIFSWEPSE